MVDFHYFLAKSDMKIIEHLVVDDLDDVGDELCVAKHLVVRNEMASVVSLACVDENLHIVAANVEFFAASVESLVVDVDEGLLMKHCVQFALGCVHVDWISDMYLILMF